MVVIPEKLVRCVRGFPADLDPAEVRRRFLSLLGPFQAASVPLNFRVTDEQALANGIVRQRVEYDVDEEESVPAVHLFQKGLDRTAPGVLAIHGHGGDQIFPVGKEYHCHPDPADPVQYAYRAALAGFRVLAPDALCFGERRTPFGYAAGWMDEVNAQAELTARAACTSSSIPTGTSCR